MEALLLALLFLLVLFRIVKQKWWDRWRMSMLMRRQGVQGPPIKLENLLSGHSKEMNERLDLARLVDMPSITHDISSRVLPFHSHYSKIYGNCFLYWWGEDATICIRDAEIAKEILVNKFGHYSRSDQQRRSLQALLGEGLVMAVGKDWAHQRRLINPAFHQQKLKAMLGTMTSSTAAMLSRWRQQVQEAGGEMEMQMDKEMSNLAADIISRTAFGSSYEEGEHIFKDLRELSQLMSKSPYYTTIPFYSYFPTEWNKQKAQTTARLEKAIGKITQERYRLAKSGEASDLGNDLLGMVMQASEKIPKTNVARNALRFVLDECKTFYFAGLDTTSTTLQWVLLLLALHPEWQERARAEVDEVTQHNIPTAEMLNGLRIVSMILYETLRLYPPASALQRQASKDIQVGSLVIPKRTCLHLSLLDIHRDPEMWGPDALEFNPDRFRDGVSKACKNPAAFLPFGLGPRTCIGQTFATLEMKQTLTMILQRFQLRLSKSYRHAPHSMLTTKPQHGLPLIVSTRASA